MTEKEALDTLKYEVYEEGHCSYIENELDIAISALEKQVSKPVIKREDYSIRYYCPVCSRPIKQTINRKELYCERCGQKLCKGE